MADILDIQRLQQQGVRQLRGIGFVFDVVRRLVLVQKTLWPPFEGGTGESDRSYVLMGIHGLIPLVGGPGLSGAMSRLVLQVTTLVVPPENWRIATVGDPVRWTPTTPIGEHSVPLVCLAAAISSLDGANNKIGDVLYKAPVDQLLNGIGEYCESLLYGAPEMIAKGLAAVQGN